MLDPILEALKDPSKDARSAAERSLREAVKAGPLSIGDASRLIRAATEPYPAPEEKWKCSVAASLVVAARDIARDRNPETLLRDIESSYPMLPADAQLAALQILILAESAEAAEMYASLLERHGADPAAGPLFTFRPGAGPEVASVLFPRLLALGGNPQLAYAIFNMFLEFRNEGLLDASIAKDYHGSIGNLLIAEVKRAISLQRPSGLGWRDEAPYSEHRDKTGLLFDLAGHLDSNRLTTILERADGLLDPRLRRFRAVSLLRRGRPVSNEELTEIAASPRDRYWLFKHLLDLGLSDRLPDVCRDQSKLAEGSMVDWLCFGTELGREPDEIELLHTETRNRSDAHILVRWAAKRKPVDYFFFKYRVTEEHWSREKGWMVGMAGGYARADQPTTASDGATFSRFEPLGSKSIGDHVRDYLG